MTLILDTHVVQWWTAEQHRLSARARDLLALTDDPAISSITWFELAWLVQHERITIHISLQTWLERLSSSIRTIGITPEIAATAARLPDPFPRDPADRLIYATAIATGGQLVTKDERLRNHRYEREIAVW